MPNPPLKANSLLLWRDSAEEVEQQDAERKQKAHARDGTVLCPQEAVGSLPDGSGDLERGQLWLSAALFFRRRGESLEE